MCLFYIVVEVSACFILMSNKCFIIYVNTFYLYIYLYSQVSERDHENVTPLIVVIKLCRTMNYYSSKDCIDYTFVFVPSACACVVARLIVTDTWTWLLHYNVCLYILQMYAFIIVMILTHCILKNIVVLRQQRVIKWYLLTRSAARVTIGCLCCGCGSVACGNDTLCDAGHAGVACVTRGTLVLSV